MSNPSEYFECRWHASSRLLAAYLGVQLLACLALWVAELPFWARAIGLCCCAAHAAWVLPRQIVLSSPAAFRGLRRDASGWHLWSASGGWQAMQLRPDSLALPLLIVLRVRLAGERRTRALCIPRDALAGDLHRRLRLRLKFSRRRWAAPE